MGKETMVGVDIDRGAEILEALDRAELKVGVAIWMYLSEYEDWRLVLSSRRFDTSDPREAYSLLHKALDSASIAPKHVPPIVILPTSDPFIRELRRRFAKARSVAGMRLGNQIFGDRFVEDAYTYRIS